MNPKLIPLSVLCSRLSKSASAVMLACMLTVIACLPAHGQTFSVLQSFAGGSTGAEPTAGLISDARGNLYGTTSASMVGQNGPGNVYRLTKGQSGWPLSALAVFGQSMQDGYQPHSRLTIGPDGAFYGTTLFGGDDQSCGGGGCGTVFRIDPAASFAHTIIYQFSYSSGARPLSELTFDSAGNMFGTTTAGGSNLGGTVFELTRQGNQWTYSAIYSFSGPSDGAEPVGGLIFDSAGNLFGTTLQGGSDCYCGVAFELSPSAGGWSYRVLQVFDDSSGLWPSGGLVIDSAGNLFGTTSAGGPGQNGGAGTVFELSPSGNNWIFSTIYAFPYLGGSGEGPFAPVLLDTAGNLYGTTYATGSNFLGSVFKLTPTNGGWAFSSLHDFSGYDGEFPLGNLLMDSSGNIYGTTYGGGANGLGAVWEFTP